MTGLPELNFPAFYLEAARLRALGYEVVNPPEKDSESEMGNWEDYLKADIRALTECDALVYMDGWETSKGAFLEISTAIALKMPVMSVNKITSKLFD